MIVCRCSHTRGQHTDDGCRGQHNQCSCPGFRELPDQRERFNVRTLIEHRYGGLRPARQHTTQQR